MIDETDLHQRIRAFQHRALEFGALLSAASSRLEQFGDLPGEELALVLQELRQSFAHLTDEALRAHPELEPALSTLSPLVAVEHTRQFLFSKEQEERRSIVQRVLRVQHDDGPAFQPLLDCQAKARDLQNADDLNLELLDDFKLFIEFVECFDHVTDEQWHATYEKIASAFGAPLAAAVGRGRLHEAPEVDGHTEQGDPDGGDPAAADAGGALPQRPTEASSEAEGNESEMSENRAHDEAEPSTEFTTTVEDNAAALPPSPERLDNSSLVWGLIRAGRIGLAYNAALALESRAMESPVPSWLLRAACLAKGMAQPTGDRASLVQQDLVLARPDDLSRDSALSLLLVSAALRPAFVAPAVTRAQDKLLTALGDGLGELYKLCREVQSFASRHQGIDPVLFAGLGDQDAWDGSLAEVTGAAQQKLVSAITINYQAATNVWRKWLESGQPIGEVLRCVAADNRECVQEIKNLLVGLSGHSRIENMVRATDKALRSGKKKEIVAGALARLLHEADEVCDLGLAWVSLHEQRSEAGSPGPLHGEISKLRTFVRKSLPGIREELLYLSSNGPSDGTRAAAAWLLGSLQDLEGLFGASVVGPSEAPPSRALNADLLLTNSVSLDERYQVEQVDATVVLSEIKSQVLSDDWDWASALRRRIAKGDYGAAALIVKEIRRESGAEVATAAERDITEALAMGQAELRERTRTTRLEIERAVTYGLLGESDRLLHLAVVVGIEASLLDYRKLSLPLRQLDEIAEDIRLRRTREVEATRARLATIDGQFDSAAHALILQRLEVGDLLSANEYIDTLLRPGAEMPTTEDHVDAEFDKFFPVALRQLEKALHEWSPPQVVSRVRRREPIPGIGMKAPSGAQAERASKMLEAWFGAKQAQAIDSANAEVILYEMGFPRPKVKVRPSPPNAKQAVAELTCEAIEDRERCPVPDFGSLAAGKYVIFCAWGRPNEEDLLHSASSAGRDRPVIVFLFGRFTEPQRRSFATLCRQHRKSILVIDDTLLLYLCGAKGSRLPVMFSCTLPFSYAEPYVTTASYLPPEMFYGRERERESLADPMGTCFVYGGRQLGKTALLREIARRVHHPEEGQIALWIDLLGKGIGLDRAIEDIWRTIADALRALGKNGPMGSLPPQAKKERILSQVETWLEGDPRRRILLLLDEADRFLESDGKAAVGEGDRTREFSTVRSLKELMDRTNRRFKVVFAGLHNVQRTTRQANNPLAHFGDPICVGPLLEDGEWRSARALAELPLTTLGYRFETPDLITRILSLTNYYPSLVQLFGSLLLRHLTSPTRFSFNPETTPPFMVTEGHVEAVYADSELRQRIRERFMLTLRLDPRYELIAYIVAYDNLLARDSAAGARGMSARRLRDEALYWWREAFVGDSSEEGVQTLLEEMVGLGVLRVGAQGEYDLRSPNIAQLMGTMAEIEDNLNASRELPVQYEPESFRSVLDPAEINEAHNRNPLTAHQIYELQRQDTSVAVLFGCKAAGIDRVGHHLEHGANFGGFVPLEGLLGKAEFGRALRDAISQKPQDVQTLICVGASCAWSDTWVQEAQSQVRRHRGSGFPVKVLFLADADTTWHVVSNGSQMPEGVRTLSLRPWTDLALRIWLQSSDLGPQNPDVRQRILDVTGGWPDFIGEFHRECRGNPAAVDRRLQTLQERLGSGGGHAWAAALGIDRREIHEVLKALTEVGESSVDDLADLLSDEGLPADLVGRTLAWGELLRLVSRRGETNWEVEPAVGRILLADGDSNV